MTNIIVNTIKCNLFKKIKKKIIEFFDIVHYNTMMPKCMCSI